MSYSSVKAEKSMTRFQPSRAKSIKKEDLGRRKYKSRYLTNIIFSEESNERLIKKLGDEILKFQETLNIEKKVKPEK